MFRHSPPPLLALYVLRFVGVRYGPGGHMGRGLAPADDDEQQRDGREDEHEGREVHEHHSFRGLVSTAGSVDTARARAAASLRVRRARQLGRVCLAPLSAKR